tara:strand:+ start:1485 stop:1724 length:240 start_codon:yes stop_codon:yes gene_type:complete
MVIFLAILDLGMVQVDRTNQCLRKDIHRMFLILQIKNGYHLILEMVTLHQKELVFHIDGQIVVKIPEVVSISPVHYKIE